MRLKSITKGIIKLVLAIVLISQESREFCMSTKSASMLRIIQSNRLNEFNLKEIVENGKLQSTRDEYEKALTQGKTDVLARYNVSSQNRQINGVSVFEYLPDNVISNKIFVHVHGGAFTLLSANSSYAIPARFSGLCGIKGFSAECGLAPENKYHNMVERVVEVTKGILSEGVSPNDIFLLGESSGGTLCVSAAHELLAQGIKVAGVMLLSPWLDLSCELISSDVDDPVLRKENYLDYAAKLVVDGDQDKQLLPFSLKYTSEFPAVMAQFGTREIFANQITEFHNLLQKSGVSSVAESYEGLWHVFQSYADLPETETAMLHLKNFLNVK